MTEDKQKPVSDRGPAQPIGRPTEKGQPKGARPAAEQAEKDNERTQKGAP